MLNEVAQSAGSALDSLPEAGQYAVLAVAFVASFALLLWCLNWLPAPARAGPGCVLAFVLCGVTVLVALGIHDGKNGARKAYMATPVGADWHQTAIPESTAPARDPACEVKKAAATDLMSFFYSCRAASATGG